MTKTVGRPRGRLIFLWGRLMCPTVVASLGPRPSPLRDLLRAFNCAGEGNIENVEGLG